MAIAANRLVGIIAGLLLICGLLVVTGCSQPQPSAIRFALASAPANLDPRFATDATSARINRLIYRALVDFDSRMQPVPALARWERLDARHYRFTLGETGRSFHDGRSLTAQDVKATYDFILDPKNGSPHRTSLAMIDSIELVDADTLDFFLSRPDPLFPGYLVIGILPDGGAGQPQGERLTPVGSGPFRFIAQPESGRVILERLSDNQRVELLQVKDPTVRVLKLERGEVDLLQNDLPAEMIAYLEDLPGIRVRHGKGSKFAYIGFNLEQGPTAKLPIRRAIGVAIDRQAIIRHLLSGAARPAGALLPPDHWAGHPDLKGLDYDPAQARALLQALGYNQEHPLELTYKTSSDPLRIRIATVIQDQLRQVGIDVVLQTYDWGTFYGDIKAGRFQLYSLAWVGIKTPDIFRYVFHSDSLPPGGANRGRYQSDKADRLIELAAEEPDLSRQANLYHQLEALLAEDLPYVPLWYEDNVVAMRDDISGYTLALDGNYDGLINVRRESD